MKIAKNGINREIYLYILDIPNGGLVEANLHA
jgi:hypothetical protein